MDNVSGEEYIPRNALTVVAVRKEYIKGNPYIGGAEMKYYVVWSDHDELLCLTTDYGLAIDVHGEYMLNNGYLTDDSWADSNAHIQCFEKFPEDYDIIMDVLSDDEKLKWKHGETVMM